MPRVNDDVVNELVENEGCRSGEVTPIHPVGIVRLALDLREARAEARHLRALLDQAAGIMNGVATQLDRVAVSSVRVRKGTRDSRVKRTKQKAT